MSDSILLERGDRTATLTLNRPPLNILDLEAIERLGELLRQLRDDDRPEASPLLILRGAGDRAFSAGVAVQDHTPERVGPMLESFHGALGRLLDWPLPTLAVVRGHCLGGGLELAAACDVVLASEESRFGQPEIELGCFPPFAAALYPRRLGPARSAELLLTGRTMGCPEAERAGLVTFRCPEEELESRLAALVERFTSKSAIVTRIAKRALRAGQEMPFDRALAECERLYLEELAVTEDMREGLDAFTEKRRPEWKHR